MFVTKNDKAKDPNVITRVIIFASATPLLTISKAIVDDIALCKVSILDATNIVQRPITSILEKLFNCIC